MDVRLRDPFALRSCTPPTPEARARRFRQFLTVDKLAERTPVTRHPLHEGGSI